MASEETMVEKNLVNLCIEAASESTESVERWRRQRRTLERMPAELADALFCRLLRRRLVSPSLLEVFQRCVEELDLKGENSVDAEWMAYLGGYHYLRVLKIADCRSINNSSLWAISGMGTLKILDISRCLKVTDAGIKHLLSIPNLEKLSVSETSVTAEGVTLFSSFRKLSLLELGGLPVTDQALRSLQVLTKLEYLDLWGSKISNEGVNVLRKLPLLNFLNIAWTNVTRLPPLRSLTCLNMSNCTIHSICEGGVEASPLMQLLIPGATFVDVREAFSYIEPSHLSFLDISNSSLHDFQFLAYMDNLTNLNISFSRMGDDSVNLIAHIGANLRNLSLGNTSISSAGVETLAGMVPNLEQLSVSHTAVDDTALAYMGLMPSLRDIDLSSTKVKGLISYRVGHEKDHALSFAALQNLHHLESLNLEDAPIRDEALQPLSAVQELKVLRLKSDFITDLSLQAFSSLPKLTWLGIRGAVLTDSGLNFFTPPPTLETLDLRDCWLLTEDTILLFHDKYTKINVRHEFVQTSSTDKQISSRLSPAQGTAKTSQLKLKKGKRYLTSSKFRKEGFADERLKYSREELLEFQFLPSSLISPHDYGIPLPKTLTE